MKAQSIFLNLAKFVTIPGISLSLLVGCGGSFNSSAISPKAPPVTSDPWTAEQQGAWESLLESETIQDPVLQTEMGRESFLQDITEQKRTHTDEELAADAEVQFQNDERMRLEKAKDEEKQEQEQEPAQKQVQQREEVPEEKNLDEKKPEPIKQEDPKPEAQKPEEKKPEEVKSPESKPEAPKPEAPKDDTKKPAEVSPKLPPPSVKSDFCEGLNVASGRGEVDLSALYNEQGTLPSAMPSQDLKNSKTIDKKNKFVCILLPVAIRLNEQVYRQRLEVLRLQNKAAKGASLSSNEQEWLAKIKVAYGLSTKHSYEELLKRVDIIPLPLFLAQAALESGWGTSRAARELNNLFGMHAGAGQPCERGQAPNSACIRKFPTLAQGVSAYIRLLNAGKPYEKFRQTRHQLRLRGEPLDSLKLLETLDRYNESPEKYIQNVREMMIHHNKLTQFTFKEEKVRPSF